MASASILAAIQACLVGGALVLALQACGDEPSSRQEDAGGATQGGQAACPVGALSCTCTLGGGCDPELTCKSGFCVQSGSSPGDAGGAAGSQGKADGGQATSGSVGTSGGEEARGGDRAAGGEPSAGAGGDGCAVGANGCACTLGGGCDPGLKCASGSCAIAPLTCPEGLTLCDLKCVSTDIDPANCGGCATDDVSPDGTGGFIEPHVCRVAPGAQGQPVCTAGLCGTVCEKGLVNCGSVYAGVPALACYDIKTSPCACGGCGAAFVAPGWLPDYPPNEPPVCLDIAHAELGASTGACCDYNAKALDDDASCGSSCADVTACDDDNPVCCKKNDGHTCTNTMSDVNNCGTCSDGAWLDGQGDCTADPSAPADDAPSCCGGQCADLNHDTANCGSCFHDCSALLPNAMPLCCPTTESAACVDGQTDVHHCGACDHDCTKICPTPSPQAPPIACLGACGCNCEPACL